MQKYTIDTNINEGKLLLKFSATWCSPCRALSPVLDNLLTGVKLKAYDVDIDDHFELAQKFQVKAVPTVLFLDNGEQRFSIVGLANSAAYADAINSLLK